MNPPPPSSLKPMLILKEGSMDWIPHSQWLISHRHLLPHSILARGRSRVVGRERGVAVLVHRSAKSPDSEFFFVRWQRELSQ
jgi:hypothetical protein